jgi:hypothetical protein
MNYIPIEPFNRSDLPGPKDAVALVEFIRAMHSSGESYQPPLKQDCYVIRHTSSVTLPPPGASLLFFLVSRFKFSQLAHKDG